jgi:histidine triad (HIT) family protein
VQVATDCAFCDIVTGRASAKLVDEWEDAVAFFPLAPATVGHTLIAPRRHVTDIWSVDETLGAKLIQHVLELSHILREALSPDGMNIINSSGRVATQTVMHLHVHLVPRYEDDGMGEIWPAESSISEAEVQEALRKIRVAR